MQPPTMTTTSPHSLAPRLHRAAWLLALALLAACASGGGAPAPAPGNTQLEFGVRMAQQGLWNEALFRFQQAVEANPGDYRTMNNLAVAYEATGRFDEALETYQRALELAPDNRELRRNYARFAEFYQSFRPQPAQAREEAGDGGGGGAPSAD